MAVEKNKWYKSIPFSSETPQLGEFYIFVDATNLAAKCEEKKENITKCRTIGVLTSTNGVYYLDSLDLPQSEPVQISMNYMQDPPPSVVIPCPVQIFGELMWKGKAVLFPRIVKVIPADSALKLNTVLNDVCKLHAATKEAWPPCEEA